ncbi:DNA endonuclease RBBP8 isoform X1 [Gadus macrocephalus]|uniref:DNA endonuclease RBBP8 isoform X1 n=1 Tax=Gadus macrocephalus TaxID=80720 RepID=UPI0028CBB578|nr:DNA endonuclease RBBP8 isoform X1 [Gadus macrocephalus]XP_059901075.1 DNA endonuclease RBBP8 isoform X1 [Gadus macrocephalus]XP_059901076.1 DNA endonuclease RBBP8 isoform X1 [Gadus macrocephalus]XP_059901077.1 DNA endonuclease RBBP8 isoform X1 [Gadus macrocephalus]XP_059901078.1 DNA endonuclease RBBP8 isoform X1 [Gadus macrocephalus]XP_059901079.1 DNA endonuclease RBBP8 isoform X1 [Gadus macrocephalus]
MSSSPGPRRTSPSCSGAAPPCVLFEELWTRLRECHQNEIQGLEAKVGKLKRDRCLDAQRLEEFYSRNQQLKEQNKALIDTVSHHEERPRAEGCDRCANLQQNFTAKQTEFENLCQKNLYLIASLKSEKNSLRDENLRLITELEKLKASISEPQRSMSPDPEDGMIPDSPIMPSSLPMANKLKRRKKHCDTKMRFAGTPLPESHCLPLDDTGLDQGLLKASSRRHKKELVLVPETCEMDACQSTRDFDPNLEDVITETCAQDLPSCPMGYRPEEEAAIPQINLIPPSKCKLGTRPHSVSAPMLSTSVYLPKSTLGESPSLLSTSNRPSGDRFVSRPKRKKVDSYHEEAEEIAPLTPPQAASPGRPHITQPPHPPTKVLVRPARDTSSRAFQEASKDPDQDVTTGLPSPDHAESKPTVEPLWSMDPALALSMYCTQSVAVAKEVQGTENESANQDETFVSHSLFQRQGHCSQDNNEDSDDDDEEALPSGRFQKANNSIDKMFDVTAFGEYNSDNSRSFDHSQPGHEEAEEGNARLQGIDNEDQKERNPTFAHIAVVRKKEERQKLKGSTCKECDIYYAHLPEEERQKKLSACSRHRFLYIPPSTPENFWEVGFPSTQTCIDRGYIKEEINPQARLRRRQPLTALFSPKRKEKDT